MQKHIDIHCRSDLRGYRITDVQTQDGTTDENNLIINPAHGIGNESNGLDIWIAMHHSASFNRIFAASVSRIRPIRKISAKASSTCRLGS